ncbi:biotin operon repressor [Salirhabdus euzebyi]|uniref:Biotin operon repressor n=1 Tax=Salirhabdus euzebyi TaxID=394506 RepID=A0A841PUF7_9BACI|nr:metalloregulator ArsR/SmtB family transcription factor [Salirhabdus euzebyi]MBB6452489.1 biotin operon repressor [Salirhabdus euzebyi]
MDVYHITSRKRETYEIRLEYSLLWECALGIAAVTNKRLINTLEKPQKYWEKLRGSFSKGLQNELKIVEEKNTWKSLLLLLHQKDFSDITEFSSFIHKLSDEEIRYICIPYIGYKHNDVRKNAAQGDILAISKMKNLTKDNPFFPDYIEFVSHVEVNYLKDHLVGVLKSWYEEFLKKDESTINSYLKTDYDAKNKMVVGMEPEEFIEWATGGVAYLPEPTVNTVLLIPQYVYRPWNIEADIEGTKVFYYPIANESIYPNDRYSPSNSLILKYKALGDEVRLRIIKLLAEKELSLQEITNELGLGKTTIHHHLKILRSANLVEVKKLKYRLKINAITSLPKELEQYLNN